MENILNCNLELCLSPPSSSPSTVIAIPATDSTSTSQHNHITCRTGFRVTDLTELQAKAIILQVTTHMEDRRWTCHRIRAEETSSPVEQLSMKSRANPSMRRSLQRFLQKRKLRVQTISPYTH